MRRPAEPPPVTGDGVVIRRARDSDRHAPQEVYRRASLSNAGDRAALLAHPEYLQLDAGLIARGRTWVASVTEQVIGFASTSRRGPAVLELDDLFVDPDWRRLGAARQLVERVVEAAADEQMTRVEVTANPHAMGFYRAVGFTGAASVETTFGTGLRLHLSVDSRNLPR